MTIHFNFTDNDEESRKQIEAHWFSTLSAEDRWKLCYATRKHISPSLAPITFLKHFITYPLIGNPEIREFDYKKSDESKVYVALKCSGVPEMYIRMVGEPGERNVQICLNNSSYY